MADLVEEEQAQKEQLERSFGAVDTRIGGVDQRAEEAGVKADFAERKAVDVGQQVDAAGKRIAESAAAIEAGVDLPLKVGERPAVFAIVAGVRPLPRHGGVGDLRPESGST